MLANSKKCRTFAPQLKEQRKNTSRPVRLGVRTRDFHSCNRGSIPLRATPIQTSLLKKEVTFFLTENQATKGKCKPKYTRFNKKALPLQHHLYIALFFN